MLPILLPSEHMLLPVRHGLIQLPAVLSRAFKSVMQLPCYSTYSTCAYSTYSTCAYVHMHMALLGNFPTILPNAYECVVCMSSRAQTWLMPLHPAQQGQYPRQMMMALGHLRQWRGWKAVLPRTTACNSPCTHIRNNTKVSKQLCPFGHSGAPVATEDVEPLLSSALYCTSPEALHFVSSCLCLPWSIHPS